MKRMGKPVDMVNITLTLFRVLYIPGGFPDFGTIKSIITIIHIGKDGKKHYQILNACLDGQRSSNPERGVVDKNLQVHNILPQLEVRSLRPASSSQIRTSPEQSSKNSSKSTVPLSHQSGSKRTITPQQKAKVPTKIT